MRRFFLPNFQDPVLTAAEAHHAFHVLRLHAGDTVNAFDGRGQEALCRITEISKDSVCLTILDRSSTPPLPFRIALAQAVPKKNMDMIVQKATELGVSAIAPLMSERTVVQLDEDSKRLSRWRDIALDACKQCGSNWLPEIQAPQSIREFLNAPGRFDLKLTASLQPDAQPLKTILSNATGLLQRKAPVILILVGPEGDFTATELSLARSAGCLPLSLGPLVLRADTAALYALSILHHELQAR